MNGTRRAVPLVKPAPGVLARVLPGQQVAACSSLHSPRLVKQPRRYPPQHGRLPNAPRSGALGCGQRFWTQGIRRSGASGIAQLPVGNGDEAARTKCNVHNLWKNLLIICGGAR